MADQLTGRALDEAAAIAMGWTVDADAFYGADGKFQGFGSLPQQSMLAWFAERKQNVHMSQYSNKSAPFCEAALGAENAIPVFGTTLNEALARLVVAVAEAKKP